MELAGVKDVSIGRASWLLDSKMYRLAKSQDFTQGIACYLIMSSTYTVLVSRFMRKQARNVFAIDARFREDKIREIAVSHEIQPLFSLPACFLESSKAF